MLPTPDVILKLNKEFENLFPDEGLPPSRKPDHKINTKPESKPLTRRAYRMAPYETVVLRETLDDLFAKCLIEPANSPVRYRSAVRAQG